MNSESLQRHQLGGLQLSCASLSEMLSIINQHAASQSGGFSIGYINPHVYNVSQSEPDVARFLNQCNLVCIDGSGTALVLRVSQGIFSKSRVHRVVALNLFDALIQHLNSPGRAVLMGIEEEEVHVSASNINKLNSNFTIVDCMDGFRSASEYEIFLKQHRQIDWILIGAGSPKSETMAMQARALCPNAIVFHMGAGTLKVYAGSKRRAPAWVSRYALEWAHRMIFEPHTRSRYTAGGWMFIRHSLSSLFRKHFNTIS